MSNFLKLTCHQNAIPYDTVKRIRQSASLENRYLWSDVNQITAEHIDIYTKNRRIERLDMLNSAMIIEQVDTSFNQVKGKKMIGYFSECVFRELKSMETTNCLFPERW